MADPKTKADTAVQIKEPKRYGILFLNDNFTTEQYVIDLLITYYNKPIHEAIPLVKKIHEEGRAIVATYPFEIAKAKLLQTEEINRRHEMPLQVKLEEV